MSLRRAASKGVLWVGIERFGQQGIKVVVFIILARLLTPEDFGLVAMLMIFFEVSKSFVQSGMGQALIREKKITKEDRATVFWFNLLISLLFYVLLYFAAPAIAAFYERPELIDLTRAMGLSVIFFGIAVVQRAEMTQQLEFKKQAYAQVPAIFIAGIVSVAMAYLGFGVWSLVALNLLMPLCSSVLLWILQPARIVLSWNKESFLKLFGFGYKLLLSGLLHSTYQNIYKLIIGKFFAASTLGFYTQASKLRDMVSQSLTEVIQKVTYPLLSKAKDDPKILKRGFRQIIKVSSFVIFPAMILLIILAEPTMVLVLGDQWAPAVPFLKIVCISGALYHLHAINLNILKVVGRSDLFLKIEVIKKINITIAIVIGIQFGIYGLLIGQVISSYVALLINTYYTARFIDYSIKEQSLDVFKVIILSFPMLVITGSLSWLFPAESIPVLFVYLLLSLLVYTSSNLLYRTDVTYTVISILKPYLNGRLKTLLHI